MVLLPYTAVVHAIFSLHSTFSPSRSSYCCVSEDLHLFETIHLSGPAYISMQKKRRLYRRLTDIIWCDKLSVMYRYRLCSEKRILSKEWRVGTSSSRIIHVVRGQLHKTIPSYSGQNQTRGSATFHTHLYILVVLTIASVWACRWEKAWRDRVALLEYQQIPSMPREVLA